MKILVLLKSFFRVEASRREKLRCKIALALSGIILAVICLAGYTVVYAKCYNIMNDESIIIFEVNEDEAALTFLGKEYRF